jgi:hypothetical protein
MLTVGFDRTRVGCRRAQEYEPPTLPSGFVFKLVLLSTWDDRFYMDLNGNQLYDYLDRPVAVTGAAPGSPSMSSSLRASAGRERAIPLCCCLV